MAITKQYLKSRPECKLTFSTPFEAKKVSVVGNFNNWDSKENQLKKLKNGTFKASVNVPATKNVEFRYIVDGEWQNANDADHYEWNDFASQNGVLEI